VVIWGPAAEAAQAAADIGAVVEGCEIESVGSAREAVERVLAGPTGAVLSLAGPVVDHESRLEGIRALRREGFTGPLLATAAFLSEQQEVLAAGTDHAFDPGRQRPGAVVAAALVTPVVCADHPYLQALLRGEWVEITQLSEDLPEQAVELLLVSTSRHHAAGFWRALADYRARHAETTVIVVEDGIGEEALADALAAGATHWFELDGQGLGALLDLARGSVRDRWLRRLASA